jgi:SAM-dependent methyltransferase
MSYFREQLEIWLKSINVNTERVLDLGGASNPVRNRVASWQIEDCVFLDSGIEEAKVEYMPFDINLPLSQLKGYLINQVNSDEKIPSPVFKFDAVFCLEVFEYVWNPVQAIQNIYDLMNNDSVAYISFPSIYPVHNPVEIDYLRYTKQAIKKYLRMFGFTQIEIIPRKATRGTIPLSLFYTQEGMHPVRGSDLPFDIGYLVKARKLITA